MLCLTIMHSWYSNFKHIINFIKYLNRYYTTIFVLKRESIIFFTYLLRYI